MGFFSRRSTTTKPFIREADKAMRRGEFDRARDLLQQAVPELEATLGPDDPKTLKARDDLLWCTGATILDDDSPTPPPAEARAYRHAALALVRDYERLLGPDDLYTLNARANLATGYMWCDEDERAAEVGRRVLADAERVLGPDDSHVMTASYTLARIYRKLGDSANERAMYERCLRLAERFGVDQMITEAREALERLEPSGAQRESKG